MPERPLLYFVDDDTVANRLFLRAGERLGYRCEVFTSATECLEALERQVPALVLTDLNMPGMDGFELIRTLAERFSQLPILAITGQSTVERAVQAMQAGAADFLKKPYELRELDMAIQRTLRFSAVSAENRRLKQRLQREKGARDMAGESPAMDEVNRMIDKLAAVDCCVILQGGSGVGKELVARAIHERGPRSDEPFTVIDCGAIADTLLESELFGHRKGAFTGAERDRTGLLESAGAGTVFLDEIGNISDAMQVKLLRVLQERTVTPVGGTEVIPIRARFIAASNRDLAALVARGEFRHDLYHRLNVVTLAIPSLAERREDIPLLVRRFAEEFAHKYDRPVRHFTGSVLQRLQQRPWEGNVRELRNFVERCVIMSDGDHLEPLDEPAAPAARPANVFGPGGGSPETLEEMELRYIREVLDSVGGNQRQAAEILGINRTTLWRKLRTVEEA
ncbi:sigma-54-dependent transcriptional regulator [Thioalbus denitrificans]|uniref:Two-component system response regulator HydG/two-component system response regulator AtoC n=1 Tax=Thioalbus denitrificans TaxID=547122 RepID=A0A369CF52_9GAMM|nr:sigma-54 dependent transcriptional regulator [Thioalbus denitrificans]RCX32303.1 two-component system response regulator HydG/two-component system response regulator AtoC [Thioalbus denitrificans]